MRLNSPLRSLEETSRSSHPHFVFVEIHAQHLTLAQAQQRHGGYRLCCVVRPEEHQAHFKLARLIGSGNDGRISDLLLQEVMGAFVLWDRVEVGARDVDFDAAARQSQEAAFSATAKRKSGRDR